MDTIRTLRAEAEACRREADACRPAGGEAVDLMAAAAWSAARHGEARRRLAMLPRLETGLQKLRDRLAEALGRERALEELAAREAAERRRLAESRADLSVILNQTRRGP